jgi:hypothetical protein
MVADRCAAMLRLTLLSSALAFCASAAAQVSTLGDVKAQGGVRLSAQELRDLMPEAKVVSRTQGGSTRYWHNRPDGTFSATTDGRGQSGGRNLYATAEGTWRVTDEGRLCVTIAWPRSPDNWCRYMFRLDNKYYGAGTLSNESTASEFEFSK